MTAAAIDLRDVYRIYAAPEGSSVALQGLSLSVAEGEVVVVLGPSGAGKTTLLRVVAGLDRPSAGIAHVLGIEPAKLRARTAAAFRARELGILDQHYARSLSPDLTCRETVGLRHDLFGSGPRVRDRRVHELLERVGLRDRGGDRPATLSGGEQQRVAVCAALAHRPRLLLADEPGGELDAASAADVYALIGELAREQGATVLMVSHDPEATAVADRLLTIRDGRFVEEAVPGGKGRLIIGRGGLLRLPEALLREAGIGRRVTAAAARNGIVVEPVGQATPESPTPDRMPAPMPATEVVAELRGVERRFGDRIVLDGLDMTFSTARLTLVVGRSGSGKTTLLNLLGGLDRPTRGEVLFLSRPISELPRAELARLRRAHVGVVGQEPGLVPFLSAAENVAFALSLRGVTADAPERTLAALTEVGLEARAEQRVDRLSAGERQRVAIARALAHRPRLLLADEPTARLDEENARQVAQLLLRAARAYGTAVVCATHDPALVTLGDGTLRLG